MSISAVTPFNSGAVAATPLNEAPSAAPLNRQLLTSVLLADQVESKIASLKMAQNDGSQYALSSDIDQQLKNFWQDTSINVTNTFEEREGSALVENDYQQRTAYLNQKGSQLAAEIEQMPAGAQKEASKLKLESFLQTHAERLERNFQMDMARARAEEAPPPVLSYPEKRHPVKPLDTDPRAVTCLAPAPPKQAPWTDGTSANAQVDMSTREAAKPVRLTIPPHSNALSIPSAVEAQRDQLDRLKYLLAASTNGR